ncbi:MAG: type II toxin-antitoxin system VapC family toxin [Gulosibacter sp.]|uniref:type II toxin-antitoxin system VapC family toxin n=1 Tax=Gulosibacter sp. TaxID=2817531 RepID=UPI003F91D6DA
MIVLDTSAAIELLLALPQSKAVQEEVERAGWRLAAPELLTIEVLQVMRRRVAAQLSSLSSANTGRALFTDLNIQFFDHSLVANRVWELRENLTAYDASYVALAELLDAPLLTTDERLARAPGHRAQVIIAGSN